MKLRWQLVLSHLVSIIVAAVVIGAVTVLLLLRNTATIEKQMVDAGLANAAHTLEQRVADLSDARDAVASFVAYAAAIGNDVETLGRLHNVLSLYRLERVEIFAGLHKTVEAYRWERGADPALATAWLPSNPSIAAQVASGQPTTWVQTTTDGPASLKLCAPVGGTGEAVRQWVVVTEPLDTDLLERLLPAQAVGALEYNREVLVAWPPSPSPPANLGELARFLPQAPFSFLFSPIEAARPTAQLDDGASLDLRVLAAPLRRGESLLIGVRTWFLVLAGGIAAAFALGSGLAGRLLSPLKSLIEGTAAMARGHLMVRLPVERHDELGALTREFNRMADEIRNTYIGVISTLAEVVEAKSHYTRDHIERVERLALGTLDVLERRGWVRFSSHQRFLFSVAAILHDVGKIAISNEILNKSGPLDSSEREQILTHPEVGALIVERMGKLERAAEIIRCAHEHYDGGGYPRGLKGEEIPLESRIILVVDAYDAMIADRPYSQGRPVEHVVTELRAEAGRQFDPVVVEAFIEAISLESPEAGAARADSGLYRALHADSDPGFSGQTPPVSPG